MNEVEAEQAAAVAARQARVEHLGQDAAVVRDDIQALEAQAVVDRDLIDHLQSEGAVDRDKLANLEVALASARRIGVAMGILMASEKITVDQAFHQLRVASQSSHRKLRGVADDVLLTGMLVQT